MDLYASEPRRLRVVQPDTPAAEKAPHAATEPVPEEAADSLGTASLTVAQLRRFIHGPGAR